MGTGSFSGGKGVKQTGHSVNHPPPPSAKVIKKIELYYYSRVSFTSLAFEFYQFLIHFFLPQLALLGLS
jgi:hypothetical protein